MVIDYSTIYRMLNYSFNQPALLEEALTHRSANGTNNERLEFLGDSILGAVISEAIYHQFPQATEGQLSRLRAALVKGDTLADIAKDIQLGDHILLGQGELKSGGFKRRSILADAVEAVIAAIYLDSDFITVKQFILQLYQQRLANATLDTDHRDAKTALQEYLQAQKMPLPQYQVISTEGDAHAQVFTIECFVDGLQTKTVGSGSSRRRAEQAAAKSFLQAVKKED